MVFFQKMAPKSPKFFITFSDTYDTYIFLKPRTSSAGSLVLTFSALSHSAGSPMKSFGLVERKRLYVKPKIP